MRIPIDRRQATPLYQQIETFLRQSIVAGTLAPTTRLPAARQVAQDLGVSRITVENAYAALEADGLVERRAGSGTYVQQPSTAGEQRQRQPGLAAVAARCPKRGWAGAGGCAG